VSFGAAIGPLAAGSLAVAGELRTLFLLTVLPGLLVVSLLTSACGDGTAKPPQERSVCAQAFDRSFRLYLLVFTLGNSSDAFLLVRAGELGVPTRTPLLWCAATSSRVPVRTSAKTS
jgi:hypothetical protein